MPTQEIRAFNRFYTQLVGALDYGGHLRTPYSLTEARVLYELAHAPAPHTDAADLRAALAIDAGQLSRLLARFERRGLVERRPSERDARRQRVELSPAGRQAAALLDERSRAAVDALLAPVPEAERERLADALRTVRRILGGDRARPGPAGAGPARLRLRAPLPGDLGWIVERNAAVYAAEYGWDSSYEALVARLVADFAAGRDPALEAAWIAELDGERAGCVMCVRDAEPDTARLRLLLVEPAARGHGVGERLVRECVDFARDAGYRELVLWTNDVLAAARRVYRRAGFALVREQRHHSFGHDLVGQDWALPLR